jgi:DNA gyrase subunit A
MDPDDEVIGMEIVSPGSSILTVTEKGYGKRTLESQYRTQSRGGKGLINLRLTPKTGNVVGIRQVFEEDDVMLMSDLGHLVRLRVADVSNIGRNTQGVRMITLGEDTRLVGLVRIEDDGSEESEEGEDTGTTPSENGE